VTQLGTPRQRDALETVLRRWIEARERIDFDRFCTIKQYFASATGEKFRVRQIAYFSMGGAAHLDCATNLANVFVSGEAMHDFGAHRVGGLPWGLYLSTGRLIRDRLVELNRAGRLESNADFDLVHAHAGFDAELLEEIRLGLYRNQERDLNIADASKFISWLRAKRRALVNSHRSLDDAVGWTIIAEAVVQASLRRTESRGCFYRSDHPMALEQMKTRFSCAYYDAEADVVTARLIRVSELADELSRDRQEIEQRAIAG
jgi:aspartate oxidase